MKRAIIRFLALLRRTYYNFINYLASLFSKLDNNVIYFDSFGGKAYNDNPFFIFNYLKENYPNYTFVWAFKDKKTIEDFKKAYPQNNYIAIKFFSFKHFKYLNKAKLWVVNYKTPTYFKKKKNTIYFQTWHGIPLKKLGCDIKDQNQTFYRSMQNYQQMIDSYINEGEKSDYFITPSNYACEKLGSAFKLKQNQLLKIGYPRNQKIYLYKDNQQYINDLKIKLNLTKKTILYAPTWRDDNSSLLGYQTTSLLDFDKMYEALKEEYQIIYRPHYLINEKKDLNKYQDFIIDASNYPDLSELMLVSDILITDYSSVYFDYSILNRPIYFAMLDLKHYQDVLRGFYINIDSDLPNDYYENEDELYHAITTQYINQDKYTNFLKNNQNFNLTYTPIDEIIKTMK